MQDFISHDIAEPLVSFDRFASSEQVLARMEAGRFKFMGIRRDGRVESYAEFADLDNGHCADYMKSFDNGQVVSSELPMTVLVFGRVGGTVSRTDVEKPPFRRWLFGMLALIEMLFNRLIEHLCPDDSWKQFLSDSRI